MRKLLNSYQYIIIVVIFLLLTLIGVSYAHFLGVINNPESGTTLTVSGGKLQISYVGGSAINVTNMIPSNTPFVTKNFTVTGNNSTATTMNYHIVLEMVTNTFSFHALQFKLTSTNTGANGAVAPSITSLQGVGSGSREIFIGNGHFTGTSGQDKVHTYQLEMFFPKISGDQSYDSGKTFSSNISIREGHSEVPELLNEKILAQFGGLSNIVEPNMTIFSQNSGANEASMYKMRDDYGMSYFYRGAKTVLNNNLIFANHQWKITRINGDGTIRLLYNGTCPGNSCTINSSGESLSMTTAVFNPNTKDNKCVGFMYSPAIHYQSTSRAEAVGNGVGSTAKSAVDLWFNNNLRDTVYENYLADNVFCSNRLLRNEVGGATTGAGFGTRVTVYAANYLLGTMRRPSLQCTQKNDRFTVSDTIGNTRLNNPIGLLSADEASVAGLTGTSNSANYLSGTTFWTMTPSEYNASGAFVYVISSSYSPANVYNQYYGYHPIRGVINLKSDTQVTGIGSTTNPFKVI